MFIRRDDDLAFVCTCIEGLSRRNKLSKKELITLIPEDGIKWMLEYASINHCEIFDFHLQDLIEKFNLPVGNFERAEITDYKKPIDHEVAMQYAEVIQMLYSDYVKGIKEVFSTEWFCNGIDNYDLPWFWQSVEYLIATYKDGYWV